MDISHNDHQSQIYSAERRIQDLRELSVDFTSKHQSHGTALERLDRQVQQLFDTIHVSKKLTTQVQNLANSISTLDNYVSSYQTLFIQGQISETLNSCLAPAQLNKLALYESKRFEEIHRTILSDDG